MWRLYQERLKTVAFIHDEVIVELKLDKQLQDNIRRVDELLVSSMRSVIKTTKITVEGALFRSWNKNAKAIYNESGDMLVWTEDIQAPNPKKADNPLNWLIGAPLDEVKKECPSNHRIVWQHGGKEFYGYQPLTSVYN